jgi:hypothetical protein
MAKLCGVSDRLLLAAWLGTQHFRCGASFVGMTVHGRVMKPQATARFEMVGGHELRRQRLASRP